MVPKANLWSLAPLAFTLLTELQSHRYCWCENLFLYLAADLEPVLVDTCLYGKAFTIDCNPARLVLGATAKLKYTYGHLIPAMSMFWSTKPSIFRVKSWPPLVVTKQASYQSITNAARFNATQSAKKSQNLDRSSKTTKDSLSFQTKMLFCCKIIILMNIFM